MANASTNLFNMNGSPEPVGSSVIRAGRPIKEFNTTLSWITTGIVPLVRHYGSSLTYRQGGDWIVSECPAVRPVIRATVIRATDADISPCGYNASSADVMQRLPNRAALQGRM